MATFVLVHGTGCGGWVWQRLTPLLRSAGHAVYAPTLTGLSDRHHLVKCGVNLTTHINDVANLIYYENLSDVILVGNSYAGMVITGVAAKIPESLKMLVFLDAYVPDEGQSEADLLPPEMLGARMADANAHDGLVQPPPPEIFGVTDPGLAEWVKARMTPHPFDTYTEPVPPGSTQSQIIPHLFIHCIGNPPTTPDLFISSAARAKAKGWQVTDLEAGHFAMLTTPDKVASVLLQAIEREV